MGLEIFLPIIVRGPFLDPTGRYSTVEPSGIYRFHTKQYIATFQPNTLEIGGHSKGSFLHETIEDIDFTVPQGRVIRGIEAIHDPDHWKYVEFLEVH